MIKKALYIIGFIAVLALVIMYIRIAYVVTKAWDCQHKIDVERACHE